MGGPGSGNWYRWDKRTTLDEVKRLDVRWLKRHGSLQPGVMATLSWRRGDRESGSISLRCDGNELTLSSRYRATRGDWQDMTQHVALDWTPCRYGGMRPWFLCPRCSRRVAVLALYGTLFLCRHCSQLPYASEHEDLMDRLWRQIRKLGQTVGAKPDESPWRWRRPKGMHWRTFERRVAQAEDLERRRDAAFYARLGALLAREQGG